MWVCLLHLCGRRGDLSGLSGEYPFFFSFLQAFRLIMGYAELWNRFPQLFETVGWGGGAGVAIALMVGVSVIPTVILQFRGSKWH